MSLSITAAQRDALYEEIHIRLSGIDAVFLAVEQQDFGRAQHLALEYSDALRLVMDDLGWGASTHVQEIKLTTSPDVLRRVLNRLHRAASSQLETEQERASEVRELELHCELVLTTCRSVLRDLDEAEPACG